MHTRYEDNSWNQLYNDILSHCDKRLQALDKMGRYGTMWKVKEIEDDELRETALWLDRNGFNSVKEMIGNIIDTLQYTLELDDLNDAYQYIKVFDETNDGYKTPLVRVYAEIKAPKIYVVRHRMLPLFHSKRCWETLPLSDRRHLESIDWGKNMPYDDWADIELAGAYDVYIYIDWNGDIVDYEKNPHPAYAV